MVNTACSVQRDWLFVVLRMSRCTQHYFSSLSPGSQNKWHHSHMAVYLWRHAAELLETLYGVYLSLCKLYALWLSVQRAPAFIALKFASHESFLNMCSLPHDQNQQFTNYKVRGIAGISLGYAGLSLVTRVPRLKAAKGEQVCLEPHSRGEEEAMGPRGMKELRQVHIFTVDGDS